MTSASELFQSRRFRPDRDPELGLRFGVFSVDRGRDQDRNRDRDRDFQHNLSRRRRGRRICLHDGYSIGGIVRGGQSPLCRGFGRGLLSSRRGGFIGENSGNGQLNDDIIAGLGFPRNERLPGAVLQARDRLLERLRGVSLAGSSRASASLSRCSRGEASTSLSSHNTPSWRCEIYASAGGAAAPPECSICLEEFERGDSLVRLHCDHRFHHACLFPWLSSGGDCPCCRSRIAYDVPTHHVTGNARQLLSNIFE
ncbi:RING/U-box superfamily protein isoform X2 [Wolffia australiana]